MTNKKIWEDQDIDDGGEISPDGKYLSYVDWNTGETALYEIATGKKQKLTSINSDQSYDKFAFSPRWFPDGRQIMYTAFLSPELSEIRSVDMEGSNGRTIFALTGKGKWLDIHDVSKDGRTILITIKKRESKTTQIALINVPNGQIRIIKQLPSTFTHNLKFSRDEKSIIYDYPSDLNSFHHDIYSLSIDGKKEFSLIKHPAHDFVLGISPDGSSLLFGSNRSGNLGFWCIGLGNGKTQGNPKYIKTSEYPYLRGLGFSENGEFFYCHFPSQTDIYETEIELETGAVVTPPHEFIRNYIGNNSAPDYSSDGKFLAFISRKSSYNSRQTFRPIGNSFIYKNYGNLKVI